MSQSARRRSDTRLRLIDAAIDGFIHVGPGNTSWADICAAAGTTKGVVAHHFPGGKEELIVAAIERNAARVDSLIIDLAMPGAAPGEGSDADLDVGAVVVRLFDLYASLLTTDPDRGCPVVAAAVDASAHHESVRLATARAFARWTQSLVTAIDDPDVAVTIVAAMEGAIVLARVQRDPDLLRRTARVLASRLLS